MNGGSGISFGILSEVCPGTGRRARRLDGRVVVVAGCVPVTGAGRCVTGDTIFHVCKAWINAKNSVVAGVVVIYAILAATNVDAIAAIAGAGISGDLAIIADD